MAAHGLSGSPSGSGTTYAPYQSKRNSAASLSSSQLSAAAAAPHRQLGPWTNSAPSLVRPQGGQHESMPAPQPFRPTSSSTSSLSGQDWQQRTAATSPPPPPPAAATTAAAAAAAAAAATSSRSSLSSALALQSSSATASPLQRPSSSNSTSSRTPRTRSPDRASSRNAPHAASTSQSSASSPVRVHSPSPAGGSSALHQRVLTQQQLQAHGVGGKAFYPAKFQPQGARRDRTEEFMSKRKRRGEGKKLEEGRLARRLEKLVALHFSLPNEGTGGGSEKADGAAPSRAGSAFATLSALRGKSAKEIWSSVAGPRGEIERAEQAIVKWQDDAEAKFCPICMAAFGLKTRRHHCRLCGRVVCFLPPTPAKPFPSLADLPLEAGASTTPIRRERCSTFFTYEYQGGVVGSEKKPIGVVIEIEPIETDLSLGAIVPELNGGGAPTPTTKEKDERKKVRVCRDCLNTVLRQQLKTLPVRTPTWLKLYEVLVQLEKEIEEILPEFQELALGLQKSSDRSVQSATSALDLRKRLLTHLASYDTIAKRIRDLPLPIESAAIPGGSQDRLQQAIASRATLFLQEKLGLLRSLGDLDDLDASKSAKKKSKAKEKDGVKSLASLLGDGAAANRLMHEKVGADELEVAEKLKILLEQEALVRSYVDDANAKRQFEDAASLQSSLNELQEEIRRLRVALQ